MKPVITILDRKTALKNQKPVPCIAITDRPTDDDYSGYTDVLKLSFLDIDYQHMLQPGVLDQYKDQIFTDEQAKQIIDFAEKHKGENMVVHCEAGMSRSQAVGLFIMKHINNDLTQFNLNYHDERRIEGGNKFVYDKLCANNMQNDSIEFEW